MTTTEWVAWAIILIVQNFAFTFVSRARNSGSLSRHLIASVCSNAVWFISQIMIFGRLYAIITGQYGLVKAISTAIFYTVFTLAGSLLAHYWALRNEKGKSAVGASQKYAQISRADWAKVCEKINLSEPAPVPTPEPEPEPPQPKKVLEWRT